MGIFFTSVGDDDNFNEFVDLFVKLVGIYRLARSRIIRVYAYWCKLIERISVARYSLFIGNYLAPVTRTGGASFVELFTRVTPSQRIPFTVWLATV